MMAAMMQQRFMATYATMSTLLSAQTPNPFAPPFMGRPFPQPAYSPLKLMANSLQKLRAVQLATPPSPVLKVNKDRMMVPAVSGNNLETVNGGYGIKNPLAKNPAIQDHLLQTMGKCLG